MPSYQFTIHDAAEEDEPLIADYECATLARTEAICLLGELLQDPNCNLKATSDLRVDVADDMELMLYSLMVVEIKSAAVPR